MNTKTTKILQQFHSKHISSINKIALEKSINILYNALFPTRMNIESSRCNIVLDEIYNILLINLRNLENIDYPEKKVDTFFEQLPKIQEDLYEDAKAFHKNDPASYSIEEVILSYPGFYALAIYRLANILYKMHIPIIPRLWAEHAHTKGGIDIHPGATIGKRFS